MSIGEVVESFPCASQLVPSGAGHLVHRQQPPAIQLLFFELRHRVRIFPGEIQFAHLGGADGASHQLHLVHATILETSVAKSFSDGEVGTASGDGRAQMISYELLRGELAIDVEVDSGGSARPVVGEDDMAPAPRFDLLATGDRDGISGPEVNQCRRQASLLQQQLIPLAGSIGPRSRAMEDHRTIGRLLRSYPQRDAEGITTAVGTDRSETECIISGQSNRFPLNPIHQGEGGVSSGG